MVSRKDATVNRPGFDRAINAGKSVAQPCILCGATASIAGTFTPDDPRQFLGVKKLLYAICVRHKVSARLFDEIERAIERHLRQKTAGTN